MYSVYIVKSKRHNETVYYTDKVYSSFEKAELFIKSKYKQIQTKVKGYSAYDAVDKVTNKTVELQICRSVVDE